MATEESIPGTPPIPNIDMLMDNKPRLKNKAEIVSFANLKYFISDKNVQFIRQ